MFPPFFILVFYYKMMKVYKCVIFMFLGREKICSLVTTLPHPTKDSSIEWKVKRLYESCMALDTIESDRYGPLRKIIHQLGKGTFI